MASLEDFKDAVKESLVKVRSGIRAMHLLCCCLRTCVYSTGGALSVCNRCSTDFTGDAGSCEVIRPCPCPF
jgi:hypothetical protein